MSAIAIDRDKEARWGPTCIGEMEPHPALGGAWLFRLPIIRQLRHVSLTEKEFLCQEVTYVDVQVGHMDAHKYLADTQYLPVEHWKGGNGRRWLRYRREIFWVESLNEEFLRWGWEFCGEPSPDDETKDWAV